jgi:hypothetical protein
MWCYTCIIWCQNTAAYDWQGLWEALRWCHIFLPFSMTASIALMPCLPVLPWQTTSGSSRWSLLPEPSSANWLGEGWSLFAQQEKSYAGHDVTARGTLLVTQPPSWTPGLPVAPHTAANASDMGRKLGSGKLALTYVHISTLATVSPVPCILDSLWLGVQPHGKGHMLSGAGAPRFTSSVSSFCTQLSLTCKS